MSSAGRRGWWIFDDALSEIGGLLTKTNFAIVDGFLGNTLASRIHLELERAYLAGKLRKRGKKWLDALVCSLDL